MPAPVNIVEKTFWENEYYWAHVELPCRPDMGAAFDRSLAAALSAHVPVRPGERVLEVGCAPAKWLVFFAESFGATVAGIEYSAKGARLSRENLAAAGVPGEIEEADFFEANASRHDLVVSIGFLEHFDKPLEVLERHLDFVQPGGRLVVGVPNFRGFNAALQGFAEPRYLALHNRAAMRPTLYRRFAWAHDLELLHLGYLGGLDPAIIRLAGGAAYSPRRVIPGVATALARRFRELAVAERIEHPWVSSYLLAVYRVPAR